MWRWLFIAGLAWPVAVAVTGVVFTAVRGSPPTGQEYQSLFPVALLGVPVVVVSVGVGAGRFRSLWGRWAAAVGLGVPVALVAVYLAVGVAVVGTLAVWGTGFP